MNTSLTHVVVLQTFLHCNAKVEPCQENALKHEKKCETWITGPVPYNQPTFTTFASFIQSTLLLQ
jgi:hypothetical protein